jgi:Nitronate monooxygenase
MLRSRFTDMFGLSYPLMSAPMALHSGGTLAGSVSAASGLGSFGGVRLSGDPAWIRSEVAKIRGRTDRPFAIGFITDFIPFVEQLFEASLSESPALLALSFGDPTPWIERCRAGVRAICQVQTVAHADIAVEAGADALAAQGKPIRHEDPACCRRHARNLRRCRAPAAVAASVATGVAPCPHLPESGRGLQGGEARHNRTPSLLEPTRRVRTSRADNERLDPHFGECLALADDGISIRIIRHHGQSCHLYVRRVPAHLLAMAAQHLDLVSDDAGVADEVAGIGVRRH